MELDGLIYLQCFRSYFILDGLWPYYCNKYSFEDLDVIKCVIELCYNSSSTVCRGSKPDSRVGGRYGEARS